MQQLNINFDQMLTDRFETCREYVQFCVLTGKKAQKVIAADMDLSPSELTRKLSQNDNDTRHFYLDDLEKYVQVTGDKSPVEWLAIKYLFGGNADRIAELEAKIKALEDKQV